MDSLKLSRGGHSCQSVFRSFLWHLNMNFSSHETFENLVKDFSGKYLNVDINQIHSNMMPLFKEVRPGSWETFLSPPRLIFFVLGQKKMTSSHIIITSLCVFNQFSVCRNCAATPELADDSSFAMLHLLCYVRYQKYIWQCFSCVVFIVVVFLCFPRFMLKLLPT